MKRCAMTGVLAMAMIISAAPDVTVTAEMDAGKNEEAFIDTELTYGTLPGADGICSNKREVQRQGVDRYREQFGYYFG